VAVPGQLDRNQPPVVHLDQSGQDRREVDLSSAKLQVLVHAAARVIDLYIDQMPTHPTHTVGG
jgi:hypothetical protein